MLQAGADIHQVTDGNHTALLLASQNPKSSVKLFEVLFEAGADPENKNTNGNNAFNYFIRASSTINAKTFAVAECLQKHGVDINNRNSYDFTPLE